MSQKRQTAFFDRSKDPRSHITSLTRDYPAGHVIPLHFHDRDQLVYASRGVMTVRTVDGVWVVPTRRAVWIPALVPHTISMSGTVAMRTLYLRPRLAKKLPRSCCVVHISGLMKELIVHACTLGSLRRKVQWQGDLIAVIIRQLEATQVVPLQLPNPTDPRALRIAKVLSENPADPRTLIVLCKVAAASKRTMERIFQEGAKVTHAALESGYSTPSAFISMFRKSLGTTPALYFKTDSSEHK